MEVEGSNRSSNKGIDGGNGNGTLLNSNLHRPVKGMKQMQTKQQQQYLYKERMLQLKARHKKNGRGNNNGGGNNSNSRSRKKKIKEENDKRHEANKKIKEKIEKLKNQGKPPGIRDKEQRSKSNKRSKNDKDKDDKDKDKDKKDKDKDKKDKDKDKKDSDDDDKKERSKSKKRSKSSKDSDSDSDDDGKKDSRSKSQKSKPNKRSKSESMKGKPNKNNGKLDDKQDKSSNDKKPNKDKDKDKPKPNNSAGGGSFSSFVKPKPKPAPQPTNGGGDDMVSQVADAISSARPPKPTPRPTKRVKPDNSKPGNNNTPTIGTKPKPTPRPTIRVNLNNKPDNINAAAAPGNNNTPTIGTKPKPTPRPTIRVNLNNKPDNINAAAAPGNNNTPTIGTKPKPTPRPTIRVNLNNKPDNTNAPPPTPRPTNRVEPSSPTKPAINVIEEDYTTVSFPTSNTAGGTATLSSPTLNTGNTDLTGTGNAEWKFVNQLTDTSTQIDGFEHSSNLHWTISSSHAWDRSDTHVYEGRTAIQSAITSDMFYQAGGGGGSSIYSDLSLTTDESFDGGVLTFMVYSRSLKLPNEGFFVTVDGRVELPPLVTASASGSNGKWVEYSVPVERGSHEIIWTHVYNPFQMQSLPPPDGEMGLWMDDLRYTPFSTTSKRLDLSKIEMINSGDGAYWELLDDGTVVAPKGKSSQEDGHADIQFALYSQRGGILRYHVKTDSTAPYHDFAILLNNDVVDTIFGEMVGYEYMSLAVPAGKQLVTLRHRTNPGNFGNSLLKKLGKPSTDGNTWLEDLSFELN